MNVSQGKLAQWSFFTQLQWAQDYLLLTGIRRLDLCWIVMILPLMNILAGKLTFYEGFFSHILYFVLRRIKV